LSGDAQAIRSEMLLPWSRLELVNSTARANIEANTGGS
jgi:hypothetical protein